MKKDGILAETRAILNWTSGKVLKATFIEWQERLQT
jgi:hypothetical protein